MGKYFISGSAGSGKSTVIEELKKRGFTAYDTDDYPGATRLEDNSGKPVDWPSQPIDWKKFSWNWSRDVILELLGSAPVVFVGGVVSNQEKFYSSFDKIFVLRINDKVHRHRLLTRTNKDFGKHPKVLADEIAFRPTREKDLMAQQNAVAVDASMPIKKVVDEILEHVHEV